MSDDPNKKVLIQGTSTRYQIKKLITRGLGIPEPKKRQVSTMWETDSSFFSREKQLYMIQSREKTINFEIMLREIGKKINSYKHQDLEKKLDVSLEIISLENVLQMLEESQLHCHYCFCDILVLYEFSRENNQWTLDRIDNNQGHTKDNVVIACLECNLKRRRTNQQAFLFTKQLTIVKHDT